MTSVAKAGIQLKLDNIKYPCEIEVGRHFVLFSDMIAPCISLCVEVQFIITIFEVYLHLQSKATVKCLKIMLPVRFEIVAR